MMKLIVKGVIGGVIGFIVGMLANIVVLNQNFAIEKVETTSAIIVYGTTLLFMYVFIKYF